MVAVETEHRIDLLQQRMDTSSFEKVSDILLCLSNMHATLPAHPVIVSLGAGTGKVEREIAIDFPHANVIAIDFSLPMIEEIQRNAFFSDQEKNLNIVRGSIDRLPFAKESCDLIVASSVVHEIASFRDHGVLGIHTEHFYQQVAKRLKPGGVFFIRDFVQPDNPDKLIDVKIGRVMQYGDTDPKEFVDRFAQEFKPIDFGYLHDQILTLKRNGVYGEGSILHLPYAHAIELGAHYSWSKRFEDEVKERYAYLPIEKYQQFIQEKFRSVGIETNVIQRYAYLQAGYPQHIYGRLDFSEPFSDKPMFLSPFTGVMAFQRTN